MSKLLQRQWVWTLVVVLVAFFPLVLPVDAVHIDEAKNWFPRTEAFLQAMRTGNYGDTVQTEHPGVTTMALGSLGQIVIGALDTDGTMSMITKIQIVRFPVNAVNGLVIVLAYLVMCRLFDRRLAFLAAITWAANPYLRWYNRLLHIDGMSTGFMALAMLLILLAFRVHLRPSAQEDMPSVGWRALLLAGIAGGFAGLTRFTAVYLIGIIGVTSLLTWFTYWKRVTIGRFFRRIALPVVVFAVVIVVVWVALYPGMWTSVDRVIDQTLHGVDNAASAHDLGNYYMGEATDIPGSDFYLYALAIRITPLMMIGSALMLLMLLIPAGRQHWRIVLVLLVYIIVYSVLLSLQAKKFDRYIVPTFPALHILAAMGLVTFWDWLQTRRALPMMVTRWAPAALIVLIIGYGTWFFPNEFAFSNPLAGGARTAEHVLLIGAGGEGMQDVARILEEESGVEDACGQYIYTRYGDTLVYYLPCAIIVRLPGDMDLDRLGNAYYIVRYISFRQRHPATAYAYDNVEPIRVLKYHGITYAEIYDAEEVRAYVRAYNAENDGAG